MFDPVGAFTKQFTPVEGGYLYYPSRGTGGKLVTTDEFVRLVSDWHRIAGPRGRWMTVGIVFGAILLQTIVARILVLPDWAERNFTLVIVVAISSRLLWASFAPRRLVRDRPVIAPPRPASQARREARALLNWPMIIFGSLLSGVFLFAGLKSPNPDWTRWAWVIGSAVLLAFYLQAAFLKFMDGRR